MTLIEFFTDCHIDNIAGCLLLRPDKLIMVGREAEMCLPVKRYRELLRQRGLRTQITLCDMQDKDLAQMCAAMEKVVREQSECVIDLTGGDESVLLAVGAVLAGLDDQRRENIRVQKFDYARGVFLDCVNAGRIWPGKAVSLTVQELIRLHGGSLHPQNFQPSPEDSRGELDRLWKIVAAAPKKWNRAIALLNEFESRADSRTQICLPLDYLRGSISNFEEKEAVVLELLEKFSRRGIIDDQSSRRVLEYTYRSPMLRYCTQKAGNVLEVKTLLEARAVQENGEPYFQDCRMSVSIDWDGVIHDPAERIPETRNEIDVILMHGAVPLFISCKNGGIGEEELYKLHTVAARFAGPHAKKMLIATDLDQKSAASNRAFIQRAWDMDIFLVTDAAELTGEEWSKLFKQAMQ